MSKGPFEKYNTKPDYFLRGESEPDSLGRIDARIKAMRREDPKVPLLRWIMIGAAAIFLAFLVNDVFFTPEARTMAAEYFEPMPNYVTSVQRGTPQEAKDVFVYYDKGDYSSFITGFEGMEEPGAVDSFYLALSYCGLSKWDDAHGVFDNLQESIPQEYKPALAWYRALAMMGSDQIENAKIELWSIAAGNSIYADSADELLDALR